MSSSLATRQRTGHIQCPTGCKTWLSACPGSSLVSSSIQLVAERGYLHVQAAHCPDSVSNWLQNVVICMSRQLTGQIQYPNGCRTRSSACPGSSLVRFSIQLFAELGYLHVQAAHWSDSVSNWFRTRLSACPGSSLVRFSIQLVAERGYLHVQAAHWSDSVTNWLQNAVI